MERYCPTDHEAIRQVEAILSEQIQYDNSITTIINDINEGEGILLRSGKRLSPFKKGGKRKYKGGMYSLLSGIAVKRRAENLAATITPSNKSKVLNGLAHVITASVFAGVVAAETRYVSSSVTCFLNPLVKSYLTSYGWLPTLCSEEAVSLTSPSSWVGAMSWGMQEMIGKTGYGDSCSMIKENYAAKVLLMQLAISYFSMLIAGGVEFFKRSVLNIKYMDIQETVYIILELIVNILASSAKGSTEYFKNLIAAIKNKLTIDRSLTQDQSDILSQFGQTIETEIAGTQAISVTREQSPEPSRERTPTPEELIPGSREATEDREDTEVMNGGRQRNHTMKKRKHKRIRSIKRGRSMKRSKSNKRSKSHRKTRHSK